MIYRNRIEKFNKYICEENIFYMLCKKDENYTCINCNIYTIPKARSVIPLYMTDKFKEKTFDLNACTSEELLC